MLKSYLQEALLVSFRLLPIMVIMPVLAFDRLPGYVRTILALALALVIASGLPAPAGELSVSNIGGEILIGMALAFGFHAAVAATDFVGRLIDTQTGLNATAIFNPDAGSTTSIIAELLVMSLGFLFLSLDMHHALLRSLAATFALIPPGQATRLLAAPLPGLMGKQFITAFSVLAPVTVGLWLVDVAFVMISRSMPQANVYFLALPVKLAAGLVLMIATAPLVISGLPRLFTVALTALSPDGGTP